MTIIGFFQDPSVKQATQSSGEEFNPFAAQQNAAKSTSQTTVSL
jgi:hypothetical protein